MDVKFNGEKLSVQATNLSDLLSELALCEKTGIAVAVNASVIPQSKWKETPLYENDDILLITAAAGG